MSSLHKYLKEGLVAIGETDVFITADSQGWKNIGGIDIEYTKWENARGLMGKYKKYMGDLRIARQFKGYDIVQLICPLPFSMVINKQIIRYLRNHNKKIVLVSCSSDYASAKAYNDGKFDFYIYDLYKEGLDDFDKKTIKGRCRVNNDKYVMRIADKIIPVNSGYAVGYLGNDKLSDIIPFPLNIDTIQYDENIVSKQITFFHGLNNEKTKGTPYIRDALCRLKEDYPDDVEVIMDGRMPFDKYTELMRRTNVVIDACLGPTYGINGMIALGMGKLLMSSFTKEAMEQFGVVESPVISIKPDAKDIYDKCCFVIKNKDKIKEWGKQSREYVEQVHDYRKVARQYLEVWKTLLIGSR